MRRAHGVVLLHRSVQASFRAEDTCRFCKLHQSSPFFIPNPCQTPELVVFTKLRSSMAYAQLISDVTCCRDHLRRKQQCMLQFGVGSLLRGYARLRPLNQPLSGQLFYLAEEDERMAPPANPPTTRNKLLHGRIR